MSRRGFTLTEVLITIGVIAILAAIALPQFQRTTERSYWRSARDILETIYAGEQVFFLRNNDQYIVFNSDLGTDWRPIFMDNPNPDAEGRPLPVNFTVALPTPTTFTATATRVGGPCAGLTQTINQNRTRGGGWPESGQCP